MGIGLLALAALVTIGLVELLDGLWRGILAGEASAYYFIANGMLGLLGAAATLAVLRMASPRWAIRRRRRRWALAMFALLPAVAAITLGLQGRLQQIGADPYGLSCFLAGSGSLAADLWRADRLAAPRRAGFAHPRGDLHRHCGGGDRQLFLRACLPDRHARPSRNLHTLPVVLGASRAALWCRDWCAGDAARAIGARHCPLTSSALYRPHVFHPSVAHDRAPSFPPDHGRQCPVGGDAPITVQTMTNTPTEDVGATIDQIRRCEDAGADIIRVSCPTAEATEHFDRITKAANVPIVADIHFHYKRALEAADKGAACLRINPGNIGSSQRVAEVVRAAKANGCAIRIGVNAGSLEKDLLEKYGEPCPEALIESALDHIKLLQDHDFHEFKVAVKASDVFLAVAAYHGLAEAVDCPLHLGITEAGGLSAAR